jgi:hypothetical protein
MIGIHTDSMTLDHACASSQNMPALFSAESNRLGNCSDPIWKPYVPAPLVTSWF